MNYFNQALETSRAQAAKVVFRPFRNELPEAAPPTGLTPIQIREQLLAEHPDLFMLISLELFTMSRDLYECIAHLMGRTNVIDPATLTDPDFREVE